MILETQHIKVFLNHNGYGVGEEKPENVQILILGNESGIGNAINIQEFINQLNGKEYTKKRASSESVITHSPFLQFTSRIVRALESKHGNWFKPKDECDVWNEISGGDFYSNSAHLIDMRPLPRPNESVWNYENIDQRDYLNGFKNFKSKDEFIQKLIEDKVSKTREQIKSYQNLKFIIAPGSAAVKKKFLQLIFPDLIFQSVEIQTNRKKMIYYLGNIESIKVVACPFFDSRNGIGYEGLEKLFELLEK